METLKNPEYWIITLLVAAVLIMSYEIIFKYKIRDKFYESVISGDYLVLLEFLIKSNSNLPNRLFSEYTSRYTDYVGRGLYRYFESRLNVTVSESRITIIKHLFDVAEREVANKPLKLRRSETYWSPIYGQLKNVIFDCGPAYFASCYVDSLDSKKDEEANTRSILLKFYNEHANSSNNKRREQIHSFVTLVNEEIDKYQKYNIPQERKESLLKEKLHIEKEIKSTTKIWATSL